MLEKLVLGIRDLSGSRYLGIDHNGLQTLVSTGYEQIPQCSRLPVIVNHDLGDCSRHFILVHDLLGVLGGIYGSLDRILPVDALPDTPDTFECPGVLFERTRESGLRRRPEHLDGNPASELIQHGTCVSVDGIVGSHQIPEGQQLFQ